MNKKMLYIIIGMIVLGSLFFMGCPLAIDISGTWNLNYDWGCTGSPYTAQWFVESDGTFTDSQDSGGTWELTGADVTFTYSGATATYSGTVNDAGTSMSGTITSSGGSTGCWSATKA